MLIEQQLKTPPKYGACPILDMNQLNVIFLWQFALYGELKFVDLGEDEDS
jgi:hypothetical protein